MKVLVHALGAEMGGAMRHISNFLPELSAEDPHSQYVVMVRATFPSLATGPNILIERTPVSRAAGWLQRIFDDGIILPVKLKRENFDAVVSLTNFGPIYSPVPHIFFQRNSLYYCNHYLRLLQGQKRIEIPLRRRLAFESMKRAEIVVTPSSAMGQMIRGRHPSLGISKFRTLHHGFARHRFCDPLEAKFEERIDRTKLKLLYPTHPGPHKGFEELFQILKLLKGDIPNFVLYSTISREDWEGVRAYEEAVAKLGLQDHVVFLGRVPQKQIGALYQCCDLMLYPSLCESFGFSLLEALAFGLPTVAADTAVAREICGKASAYYPINNPEAAAGVIRCALEHGNGSRMKSAAEVRFNEFDWSWKRYAREFIDILKSVV